MIIDFAERTGISVDDILGECRTVEIVAARHLYWKLLKEKRGYSLSTIGRLNDRTHATIKSGIEKVNGMLAVGDKFITEMWDKVKDIE